MILPQKNPETLTLRDWYRYLRADGWEASEAIRTARRSVGLTEMELRNRWQAELEAVFSCAVSAGMPKPAAKTDRTQVSFFRLMTNGLGPQ